MNEAINIPAVSRNRAPLAGRTVVVTGASGQLGSGLVVALEKAGARTLLVGRSPDKLASLFPGRTTCSNENLGDLLRTENVDCVVDLAVLNNNKDASLEDFRAVNVERFQRLVEEARAAGVPQFIAFSTTHAIDPEIQSAYAISKREARQWVEEREDGYVQLLTLPKVIHAKRGSLRGMFWSSISALKPLTIRPDVEDALISMIAQGGKGPSHKMVCKSGTSASYRALSSLMDIGFALSVIIFFGWLMLIIALLIKLDSKGPIIFAQRRVGRHERPFTLYKFRTMSVGTREAGTHEITTSSVTRLGIYLRRFKLDELPQILNILKRELSLVGPRPCLSGQTEVIAERRAAGIFEMRPGLTGLAQVRRVDMSTPKLLVSWEKRYMQLRNLKLDIQIVLQTFLGRGGGDRTRASLEPGQ